MCVVYGIWLWSLLYTKSFSPRRLQEPSLLRNSFHTWKRRQVSVFCLLCWQLAPSRWGTLGNLIRHRRWCRIRPLRGEPVGFRWSAIDVSGTCMCSSTVSFHVKWTARFILTLGSFMISSTLRVPESSASSFLKRVLNRFTSVELNVFFAWGCGAPRSLPIVVVGTWASDAESLIFGFQT